ESRGRPIQSTLRSVGGVISCNGGLLTGVPPYTETERSRIESDELRILKRAHGPTGRRLADEPSRWLRTALPPLISFPYYGRCADLNLHFEITTCPKIRICSE